MQRVECAEGAGSGHRSRRELDKPKKTHVNLVDEFVYGGVDCPLLPVPPLCRAGVETDLPLRPLQEVIILWFAVPTPLPLFAGLGLVLEHQPIRLSEDLFPNGPVQLIKRHVGNVSFRTHHPVMQAREIDFACRAAYRLGAWWGHTGDDWEDFTFHSQRRCGVPFWMRGGVAQIE